MTALLTFSIPARLFHFLHFLTFFASLAAVELFSKLPTFDFRYFVITMASTFIPGRNTALSGGIGSSTIFTGILCTTFT